MNESNNDERSIEIKKKPKDKGGWIGKGAPTKKQRKNKGGDDAEFEAKDDEPIIPVLKNSEEEFKEKSNKEDSDTSGTEDP